MRRAICENGGCLAKLSGNELVSMLKNAQTLAGFDTDSDRIRGAVDDCSVVNCASSTLLLTIDQNPPVGHDHFVAGKIAALHAISDVYAMGGIPLYALALLVLGNNSTAEHSESYMAGLYTACNEESVSIVGGHTTQSAEPLLGLSVVGIPSESTNVLAKRNCVVGDHILISKPIGTGMILRGYYNGLLSDSDYSSAIEVMTESNKLGSQIASCQGLHALTDITGFGLLGHLSEMLSKGQGARINMGSIPFLDAIHSLPAIQLRSRFTEDNVFYLSRKKRFDYEITTPEQLALFDPQTNGALLAIADECGANALITAGFACIGIISNVDSVELVG